MGCLTLVVLPHERFTEDMSGFSPFGCDWSRLGGDGTGEGSSWDQGSGGIVWVGFGRSSRRDEFCWTQGETSKLV